MAAPDFLAPVVEVTAGLICDEGGRYLITRRVAGSHLEGLWEFPGGKVEDGEDPRACLARELREELAIEATIGPEVHRTSHCYSNGFAVELLFYRVEAYCGAPQNRAFQEVRWAAPAELPELDFLEADRELVKLLAAGRL